MANEKETKLYSVERYDDGLLDISGAKHVEVQLRQDGKVLWVNKDGRCVLRICMIENPVKFDLPRPRRVK